MVQPVLEKGPSAIGAVGEDSVIEGTVQLGYIPSRSRLCRADHGNHPLWHRSAPSHTSSATLGWVRRGSGGREGCWLRHRVHDSSSVGWLDVRMFGFILHALSCRSFIRHILHSTRSKAQPLWSTLVGFCRALIAVIAGHCMCSVSMYVSRSCRHAFHNSRGDVWVDMCELLVAHARDGWLCV